MLIKKTCTSNSFVALPRINATAVDCALELTTGRLAKFSKISKLEVLNKVEEGDIKRDN